jgi:hypothetical protein
MDGQVVPLLDYLEIRPENRDRIQAQVEAGRLIFTGRPNFIPLKECIKMKHKIPTRMGKPERC